MQVEDALQMISNILQNNEYIQLQNKVQVKPMRSLSWEQNEDEELVRLMVNGKCNTWNNVAKSISLQCNTCIKTGIQVSQHWRRVISFRVNDDNFNKQHDNLIKQAITQQQNILQLEKQLNKTELEMAESH